MASTSPQPALQLAVSTLLLSFLASIPHQATASPGLWDSKLPYGPIPPLEDRPPISRGAVSDKSKVKWLVIGIVGGYVLTLLFIGTSLLTFGRRLRRVALSSNGMLSIEMAKPKRTNLEALPATQKAPPGKTWGGAPSTVSSTKSADSSAKSTPVVGRGNGFDDKVLEDAKLKREQEMERLYAAALDQNAVAPKSISISDQEFNGHNRDLSSSSTATTRNFSRPQPAQIVNVRASGSNASDSAGPRSPHSFHSTHSRQQSFESSINREYTNSSPARHNGTSSYRNKRSRTVRDLNISAPIQAQPPNLQGKYPYGSSADEKEARTPLSPQHQPHRSQSNGGTQPRPITPIQDHEDVEDDDIIEAYGYEGLQQRRPLPHSAPQRNDHYYPHPHHQQLQGSRSAKSTPPPLPPPPKGHAPPQPHSQAPMPALQTQNLAQTRLGYTNSPHTAGSTSTAATLPFRSYSNTNNNDSPSSPTHQTTLPSPGPMKTTVLSPPAPAPGHYHRHGQRQHPHGFVPMGPGTTNAATPGSPALSPSVQHAMAGLCAPGTPAGRAAAARGPGGPGSPGSVRPPGHHVTSPYNPSLMGNPTSPHYGGAPYSATMQPPYSATTQTVPYSPPYSAALMSPRTPVTPRLMGKAEKKARRREEGGKVRKAVTWEDDGVKDEGEMWGYGL